jgi:hypothetical protein
VEEVQEEDQGGEESLEEVVRTMSTGLEELAGQVVELIAGREETDDLTIRAIQMLDEAVRAVSERLDTIQQVVDGLSQDEASRLQDTLAGDDWTRSLFAATRDLTPEEQVQDGDLPSEGQQVPHTQLRQEETVLERLLASQTQ